MRVLRALFAFLYVLSLSAHGAYLQASVAKSSGGGMPVPTLVQHIGSTVNDNNGIAGNGFTYTLPNTTLSGNALVLETTYPYSASRTVTITDSTGDTWTQAGTTTTDSVNLAQQIYVDANATPALHSVTVTFDTALKPVAMELSEFYNVATSSPVDGTKGAANVASPNVAVGSFTPSTNNDANGGHLILAYTRSNDRVGANNANAASNISNTASMAFLSADNTCTIPGAASYIVQATNGAINPGWTITQSTGTNFISTAVALKAANAGTAPGAGIRVKRILHATYVLGGSSAVFQFPSDGNLLVAAWSAGSDINPISLVTDSNSQSYTNPGAASEPQVFYHQNATPSNTLKLTVAISGQQDSVRMLDIVGAQASSFDTVAGIYTANPGTGNVTVDLPTFTPTIPVGLAVNSVGFGTGPGTGMGAGSPAASVFGLVDYTGETDQDRMDNADAFSTTYFASTATQHMIYAFGNASRGSTAFGTSVSFK